MLDRLKKWFALPTRGAHTGTWAEVTRWAEARGCEFRRVRDAHGFVVDGRQGATAWRLEWGPSQRCYVDGQELRLRAEFDVPLDLQALVLNRELQEQMEKDVFDQYIEGVQTRVDTQTPPEMRWLVMFPKLSGQEMKGLRERWVAVANLKPWLEAWIGGPLAAVLQAQPAGADQPLALAVARGRLTLRAAVADPDSAVLDGYLKLFQTALLEARRVSAEFTDVSAPSTQPSLFSASVLTAAAASH